MSRGRTFNCVHFVDGVQEAILWVDQKLHENDKIKFYRAQIEEGDNGGLHVQAMFGFENARSLRSAQLMVDEPKVQLTMNPDVIYFYCTNEEKRYPDTQLMQKGDYKVTGKVEDRLKDMEIAEQLSTFTEAMEYMEKKHKLWAMTNYKSMAAYFLRKFPNGDDPEYTLDQFTEPPIDPKLLKRKTIVLCGPPSYGKTSYAMAHFKQPAVIKTKCDYVKITAKTDGVIFDDMALCNWSISTVKNLVNLNLTSNQDVKYGHARMEKFLPRFVCVQNESDFWPKELFDEAGLLREGDNTNHHKGIRRRIIMKNLTKPLYNTTDAAIDKDVYECETTLGTMTNPNEKTMKRGYNNNNRFHPYE